MAKGSPFGSPRVIRATTASAAADNFPVDDLGDLNVEATAAAESAKVSFGAGGG